MAPLLAALPDGIGDGKSSGQQYLIFLVGMGGFECPQPGGAVAAMGRGPS